MFNVKTENGYQEEKMSVYLISGIEIHTRWTKVTHLHNHAVDVVVKTAHPSARSRQ
jgi:hypothetical protein